MTWAVSLWLIAFCGAAVLRVAQAEDAPASAAAQRAEIARERAAIDRRFTEQDAACRERFVVSSCLNEARQQRRSALAPLRQEELRIDTGERKLRAAARLEEIEEKQRAEAVRDSASSAQSVRAPAAPQAPASPSARIGRPPPVVAIGAAERARREAQSQEKYDRQQQEFERHRAQVEARNADRAAHGKVAKPLPPASAASTP